MAGFRAEYPDGTGFGGMAGYIGQALGLVMDDIYEKTGGHFEKITGDIKFEYVRSDGFKFTVTTDFEGFSWLAHITKMR